jgi:hypothetical protein
MNCQRLSIILALLLASTAQSAVPGNAAVATRAHAANQLSPGKQRLLVAKIARMEKRNMDKRAREKARRIAAYTLFRDPQFKLEGAITDKRHFDAILRGSKFNARTDLQTPAGGIPPNAFKASQQDNSGLDFNCHEKILNPAVANRETSACYQYELGKTWKAQTYVSRQRTEGNWGGGLSLGFAY